jgi:hypothetical protein
LRILQLQQVQLLLCRHLEQLALLLSLYPIALLLNRVILYVAIFFPVLWGYFAYPIWEQIGGRMPSLSECAQAIMQLTRTLHPPATADPILLIMQGSVSLNFLITPVLLGSCILVLIAMIYNNFIAKRQYPRDINSGGWFGQMFK